MKIFNLPDGRLKGVILLLILPLALGLFLLFAYLACPLEILLHLKP